MSDPCCHCHCHSDDFFALEASYNLAAANPIVRGSRYELEIWSSSPTGASPTRRRIRLTEHGCAGSLPRILWLSCPRGLPQRIATLHQYGLLSQMQLNGSHLEVECRDADKQCSHECEPNHACAGAEQLGNEARVSHQ